MTMKLKDITDLYVAEAKKYASSEKLVQHCPELKKWLEKNGMNVLDSKVIFYNDTIKFDAVILDQKPVEELLISILIDKNGKVIEK